ncbi:MAG: hypothetical protein ABH856_04805 [Patescibacteria group bacterium]|nr:hypothetical protein [Patescibacteria group bacterium]
MKHLIIMITTILLIFGIGCANIHTITPQCGGIEIGDLLINVPEDSEFEVTLINKGNKHLAVSHTAENVTLDIGVEPIEWGSIEEIRANLDDGKNHIAEWRNGYKVEVYHEQIEVMGHERFIYFYHPGGSHNVIFTQYDFTGGDKFDERIERLIDAIDINIGP